MYHCLIIHFFFNLHPHCMCMITFNLFIAGEFEYVYGMAVHFLFPEKMMVMRSQYLP